MRRCRLLILTAVQTEARAVARAFRLDEFSLTGGLVYDENISLGVTGIRACRLPELLSDFHPELLIMTGLAGALAPALKVGDVVIDAPLPAFRPPHFSIHEGRFHTARNIVATPAAKAALFTQTGALAVDMETAVVQALAQKRGIPFLVIRAISDAADQPLDPHLFSLVDAQGRPRAASVAAYLLTGPWRMPALLRIGRATKMALTNLVAVLQHCAATSWPDNRQTVSPAVASLTPPEKS